MTLKELSVQYGESAEICRRRFRELQEKLANDVMSETEKLILRRRICLVESMARDAAATSRYLNNYYGRQSVD